MNAFVFAHADARDRFGPANAHEGKVRTGPQIFDYRIATTRVAVCEETKYADFIDTKVGGMPHVAWDIQEQVGPPLPAAHERANAALLAKCPKGMQYHRAAYMEKGFDVVLRHSFPL